MLKALADEDRLRIIEQLRGGEQTVGALAEALKLEIANVSHHLRVLRESGFVSFTREGRFMRYRLADGVLHASRQHGDQIDLGCCRLEWPRPLA